MIKVVFIDHDGQGPIHGLYTAESTCYIQVEEVVVLQSTYWRKLFFVQWMKQLARELDLAFIMGILMCCI